MARAGTPTRATARPTCRSLKQVAGTDLGPDTSRAWRSAILGEGRWDWVVLVLYPSRAAFLAMMTSPEYALANVDRENGVKDHVILAAHQTYSKLATR